jgi:hypothetical protein
MLCIEDWVAPWSSAPPRGGYALHRRLLINLGLNHRENIGAGLIAGYDSNQLLNLETSFFKERVAKFYFKIAINRSLWVCDKLEGSLSNMGFFLLFSL